MRNRCSVFNGISESARIKVLFLEFYSPHNFKLLWIYVSIIFGQPNSNIPAKYRAKTNLDGSFLELEGTTFVLKESSTIPFFNLCLLSPRKYSKRNIDNLRASIIERHLNRTIFSMEKIPNFLRFQKKKHHWRLLWSFVDETWIDSRNKKKEKKTEQNFDTILTRHLSETPHSFPTSRDLIHKSLKSIFSSLLERHEKKGDEEPKKKKRKRESSGIGFSDSAMKPNCWVDAFQK